jgi:hypothetical protein
VINGVTPKGDAVLATFTLGVRSPAPRRFTGSLLIAFFGYHDPKQFETAVNLSSNGSGVHHSVTDHVTSVPGLYNVRVQLQESGADLPTPRVHEFIVPVRVK